MLAKGLVAGNELRAVQVLAHYIFVRGLVNASDPITFESRRNPALFCAPVQILILDRELKVP